MLNTEVGNVQFYILCKILNLEKILKLDFFVCLSVCFTLKDYKSDAESKLSCRKRLMQKSTCSSVFIFISAKWSELSNEDQVLFVWQKRTETLCSKFH